MSEEWMDQLERDIDDMMAERDWQGTISWDEVVSLPRGLVLEGKASAFSKDAVEEELRRQLGGTYANGTAKYATDVAGLRRILDDLKVQEIEEAAEWEAAAARGIRWGRTVWEWTADPFAPYTQGFRPGPYSTYSAPWFHHQRELRGGSYCTDALVHDARYRNFFLPQRTDVFAGFRTAATT